MEDEFQDAKDDGEDEEEQEADNGARKRQRQDDSPEDPVDVYSRDGENMDTESSSCEASDPATSQEDAEKRQRYAQELSSAFTAMASGNAENGQQAAQALASTMLEVCSWPAPFFGPSGRIGYRCPSRRRVGAPRSECRQGASSLCILTAQSRFAAYLHMFARARLGLSAWFPKHRSDHPMHPLHGELLNGVVCTDTKCSGRLDAYAQTIGGRAS